MTRIREWIHRIGSTFLARRDDEDLAQELRSHVEFAVDDERRRTASCNGDVRRAAIKAGGISPAMEALRDQRGVPWLAAVPRDLRYAYRLLARTPAFTFVATVSLAIGIGANCAVFSFADTLLLRPLTVPRPQEVATVGMAEPSSDSPGASYREYVDIRERSKSFEGLVAYTKATVGFTAVPEATPALGTGLFVSDNFFKAMGVEPQLGRDFQPAEHRVPGRDAVVILGHEFWKRQFAGDPSVLGRTVQLNGLPFTIVGIAPEGFTGLDQYVRFQFYAPLMMWPRLTADSSARAFEARDYRALRLAGRLGPGVTMSDARTELSIIGADLARAYPTTNRNRRIVVRTELQNRIAQTPTVAVLIAMLTMLAAAVLFVACANVAGLLTSRAPVRAREIALRLAIGASRGRVVAQLVTESLLLALAGGALGVAVGYAAVMLFSRIQIPTELPIAVEFRIDTRALFFSLIVAVISAIAFGVAPAIHATRTDLTAVMKATDASGISGGRRWARTALVTGQVAVAVVLLVLATFVYRGFRRQLDAGPGFPVDHLLMMSVTPTVLQYDQERTRRVFEQLADRAQLLPGVTAAGLTRYMPMDGLPPTIAIVPQGFQFPAGKDSATEASSIVDEHYFDAIRVPIVKGRAFRTNDTPQAPRVAIVNEAFADRYWPNQDVIGKRFRLNGSAGALVEIVGVAKTTKYSFVIERPKPFVYLPYRQQRSDSLFLLVRFDGDPALLVSRLRDAVHQLDPSLPVANVRTMDELYRMRSVEVLHVLIACIGAMGVMALALSIVGLYGLVAYAASRRTKEIGIRVAVGADRSDIVRMMMRHGLVIAIAGLTFGLAAGVFAARALWIVFPGGPAGDGRTDPLAFVSVAAVVLAVTLVAAYLPAHRASAINPIDALRRD